MWCQWCNDENQAELLNQEKRLRITCQRRKQEKQSSSFLSQIKVSGCETLTTGNILTSYKEEQETNMKEKRHAGLMQDSEYEFVFCLSEMFSHGFELSVTRPPPWTALIRRWTRVCFMCCTARPCPYPPSTTCCTRLPDRHPKETRSWGCCSCRWDWTNSNSFDIFVQGRKEGIISDWFY